MLSKMKGVHQLCLCVCVCGCVAVGGRGGYTLTPFFGNLAHFSTNFLHAPRSPICIALAAIFEGFTSTHPLPAWDVSAHFAPASSMAGGGRITGHVGQVLPSVYPPPKHNGGSAVFFWRHQRRNEQGEGHD